MRSIVASPTILIPVLLLLVILNLRIVFHRLISPIVCLHTAWHFTPFVRPHSKMCAMHNPCCTSIYVAKHQSDIVWTYHMTRHVTKGMSRTFWIINVWVDPARKRDDPFLANCYKIDCYEIFNQTIVGPVSFFFLI